MSFIDDNNHRLGELLGLQTEGCSFCGCWCSFKEFVRRQLIEMGDISVEWQYCFDFDKAARDFGIDHIYEEVNASDFDEDDPDLTELDLNLVKSCNGMIAIWRK